MPAQRRWTGQAPRALPHQATTTPALVHNARRCGLMTTDSAAEREAPEPEDAGLRKDALHRRAAAVGWLAPKRPEPLAEVAERAVLEHAYVVARQREHVRDLACGQVEHEAQHQHLALDRRQSFDQEQQLAVGYP